jgi:hypothetical protein
VITLIGDSIENSGNARALIDSATLFGGHCLFRNLRGSSTALAYGHPDEPLSVCTTEDIRAGYTPVLGLENLRGQPVCTASV